MLKDDRILNQIYNMQQRGGRMLSIIDLIKAETLSIDLASYIIYRVADGASISSGSLIGGTGKTTLLASILSFLPPERDIITVTDSNLHSLLKVYTPEKKITYLCHEISPAPYFSYLWGKDIARYFSLKRDNNKQLAFTIHADTIEEVYKQIVNENTGLKNSDFMKIDLLVFIKKIQIQNKTLRKITYLYDTDEKRESHRLLYNFYEYKNDAEFSIPSTIDKNKINKIKELLHKLNKLSIFEIENVRHKLLSLLPEIFN